MHARPRRAAGPGQLSGLQPPADTGRGAPSPARLRPRPAPGRGKTGGASPGFRGTSRGRTAPCVPARAASAAWACSPGVGESHGQDSARGLASGGGAGGGVRVRPGLTPAPESPGVAREREEVFPAAGSRGGGAALRRVAVSSLPELMSTWDYLLSDCARIYSGSVLSVKKQGGLNPGLVMY